MFTNSSNIKRCPLHPRDSLVKDLDIKENKHIILTKAYKKENNNKHIRYFETELQKKQEN